MKRSNSMNNLESILPPLPSNRRMERGDEGRSSHEDPAALRTSHSHSSSSILSPSSAISYEFSFLSSPGIPLSTEEHFALPNSPPPVVEEPQRKSLRIVEWSRSTEMVNNDEEHSAHSDADSCHSSITGDDNLHAEVDKGMLTSSSSTTKANSTGNLSEGATRTETPNDKENRSLDDLDPIDCLSSLSIGVDKSIVPAKEMTSPEDFVSSSINDQQSDDDGVDVGEKEDEESVGNEEGAEKQRELSPEEHDYSDARHVMEESGVDNYRTSESSPEGDDVEKKLQELEERPYLLEQLQREILGSSYMARSNTPPITIEDSGTTLAKNAELDDVPAGTPYPSSAIDLDMVFPGFEKHKHIDLPSICEEDISENERLRPGVCHRSAPSLETVGEEERRGEELEVPQAMSSRETSTDSINMDNGIVHSSSMFQNAPLHRRAISDHLGHLTRHREHDEGGSGAGAIPRLGEQDVRVRPKSTRSMVANRCHSQIIRNASHDSPLLAGTGGLDRTQSSSDPALNEQMMDAQEIQRQAEEPPPVVLQRKATRQSWKHHMPSFASPHNVIPPSIASMPSRHMTPPTGTPPIDVNANSRPGDKYRVEKKKEKGGNLLESLFFSERRAKKKKNERPALESIPGFTSGMAARSGSAPVGQHLRRQTVGGDALGATKILPHVEGLPDDLAFLSPTGSGPAMDFEDGQQEPQSRIQLDSPLWSRFGLFDDDEYNSWSKKFRIDHLTQKDVLRQDKIFELIIAEKKHCANLAFLKQAYRARFMEDCQELSLSPKDVDSLVPDVLDAMLQFHLHLLDRLVQRQKEGEQVYTIADIVEEELSERGKHTSIAVQAYTTFGANKEESEKYFDRLKKSALFRKYLEDLVASDPWYRKFEKFKTLLTKIMAHSTRYHMILEDIRKNDTEESRKVANLKAVEAAKGFALRIDHALSVSHMTRKWEAIRREMDWGAKTMLATNNAACPLVDFLMSDLRSDTGAGVDGRKIMCIGDVTMKNNGEKIIGDNSCLLILFDDILVFLQRRQHKITFFPQEQAVFAVSSLHARSMERGWSAHILSSSFKPMLMELQFPNKSDRAKWMSVFEKAIQRAPKQVRMPARKEGEAAKERELEEKRQKQAEDEWMKKLEKMFEERKGSENVVADYIEKRMEWFDQLRGHINSMPFKGRSDLPEKVKAGVRQRFRELRQSRVEPISKLISKCTTARDHDLLDFFDDAAELNNLESDSGSDSSTSESKNLPRRVQTFHGTTTPKREKGSFRRHTTVPKMNSLPQSSSSHGNLDEVMRREAREDMENGGGEESGDEKERERDEEISAMTHRLPLGMHLKARRAATHLIKENVSLRTEISYLKNELGLNKTRLSLLERSRCVPGQALAGPAVPPSETLEALRKKEQELRDGETKFRQREEDMAEKQKTLEARVQKSETELAERWRVLLEREGKGGNVVNNLHSSTNPSGNVRGTTPSSPSTTSSGMGTMGPPLGVTAGVPPLRGGTLPSGAKPISPALMSLSEKVQIKKKK